DRVGFQNWVQKRACIYIYTSVVPKGKRVPLCTASSCARSKQFKTTPCVPDLRSFTSSYILCPKHTTILLVFLLCSNCSPPASPDTVQCPFSPCHPYCPCMQNTIVG
ncbi:unnamed protein product, partial [Choristocarpus tenellus]